MAGPFTFCLALKVLRNDQRLYVYAQQWQLVTRVQKRKQVRQDSAILVLQRFVRRILACQQRKRLEREHRAALTAAKHPWLSLLLEASDVAPPAQAPTMTPKSQLLLGVLQNWAQSNDTITGDIEQQSKDATSDFLLDSLVADDDKEDEDGTMEDYINHNNAVFAIQLEMRMVDMLVSQYCEQQEVHQMSGSFISTVG